jgi:hypothetical protein
MELESARQLKEELLAGIALRVQSRGDGSDPSIAVGIAPPLRKGQFRIAIRPRFPRDLVGLRDYIDDLTAGEFDVRVTGVIRAAGSPTLDMGASISRAEKPCRTGSVGFFARRNHDGAIGFVSNNHILAAEDAGQEGDLIIHPGRGDRSQGQSSRAGVASLDGNYPRLLGKGVGVDCAFARLLDEDNVAAAPFGEPAVAMSDLAVTKRGWSTHETHGRVSAFSLDRCLVDYARSRIEFQGQIEIESVDRHPFATGGDSGSLVLTEEGCPVGLLHSVSGAGGRTHNSGLTFANPILSILHALDVSFL